MNASAASLADNVRQLRLAFGLSLAQLADRSGVAKATLFKIEQGQTNPTLDTLVSIATAFDVPVVELLTEATSSGIEVVRAGEGTDVSDDASIGLILRSQVVGAGLLEIYTQTFRAGRAVVSPSHGPGSREHVYIISGKLELGPTGEEIVALAGDYVTYPADVAHRWRAVRRNAEVLVVHTTPRAAVQPDA